MRAKFRAFGLMVLWLCALGAQPATVPAGRPASEADDAPDCSLSVNGAGETDIEPGLPVVVEAFLVLAPDDKGTTARMNITSREDKALTLPLEAVKTADDEQHKLWLLSPEASRQVAPGDYLVSIALVKGEETIAESAPAAIRISPQARLDDDDRNLINLRYQLARGNKDEAGRIAKQWLAKNPKSVDALVALGDLAVAADDLPAALKHYQAAIDLVVRPTAQDGGEPPRALLARRSAVYRALLKREGGAATSPAAEKERAK